MAFELGLADIWNEFKKASRTERGTLDDNSNEVILGPRLNDAVHEWANGYLKTLKFDRETRAMDERAKLLDLHWGHIEHDGALLRGVGAAMTNFAEVLATNVTTLGDHWKGDSYDAFKTAIDKVQRTVAEYGAAATITGDSLVNAMGQIRELYQTFAEDSVRAHLHFEVSPPKEWHKVPSDGYQPGDLVDACPTAHTNPIMCLKGHPEQVSHLAGHWVTERRWEICRNDPCETNAGRVIIMYDDMVDECEKAIGHIKGKLNNFYGAVNTVVEGVTGLYGIALDNVHNLGDEEVFQSLRVIGGQPVGGGAPVDGGYPPPGGATPYPTGGDPVPTGGDPAPTGDPGPTGDPVPTGADPAPTDGDAVATGADPEPTDGDAAPADADTGPAEAVGPDPADAVAPDPAADQGESVRIQDGDRTIGVTSPDGESTVRVTVQDAAGQTKTYDLDFATASGLPSAQPPEGTDGAEHVPARTDGKCVIQDGPLTITAERPLFSPDSISLQVDDGSGAPRTYTVDFDDQPTDPTDAGPAGGSANPAAAGPSTASAGTGVAGPGAVGGQGSPADEPAGSTSADPSAASQATAGPSTVADQPITAGAGPGVAGPGAVGDQASPADQQAIADQAHANGAAVTSGSTAPMASSQGWHGEQAGSVSGVLVPDHDGEAELAAAPDDAVPQVGGPVGAGLPMMGNSQERAGSGWSVHGDLFDNAEPVYSMHGVLGDDDGVSD